MSEDDGVLESCQTRGSNYLDRYKEIAKVLTKDSLHYIEKTNWILNEKMFLGN